MPFWLWMGTSWCPFDRRSALAPRWRCRPLGGRRAGRPGSGHHEGIVLASGPKPGPPSTGRQEWQVLTASALVGPGQTALEMGSDYAQQRRFGVLSAWFQTVQHRLAMP